MYPPPPIDITSPVGGENWGIGTSHDITWAHRYDTNVNIEYTTNNGTNWSTVIASTPASSDSFSWTIPNTLSTQCKVRISDVINSSLNSVSANVFTISVLGSGDPCPGTPTVVYEGKTYHYVAIGNQCWLKENLDVGTRINGLVDQTNNSTIEKYCYNDDTAACTGWGGLYQWAEAVQYKNGATNTSPANPPISGNVQGICPSGWHIPTNAEFQTLVTKVDTNGNALKAVGQGGGDGIGTNTSGFSALLAGARDYDRPFVGDGFIAFFWSSSERNPTNAYLMSLYLPERRVFVGGHYKVIGSSVRCLKDLSDSPLPVELGLFTAVPNERSIQLNWTTQTEKNSNKFVVERKVISSNWEAIGSVKAAVLSNSPKQYSFIDKDLQSGKYLYKLKMIDNDGTFKYSKVIETEVTVPKNFELSQNYPNPFNPSTKINYQLPIDAKVLLEVYNITGERISQLVNNEQSAGFYSVDFNSSLINGNLPSGIYFYRMSALNKATGNNFLAIKKMILLK
jgi:uncharacterized protein (TIGR02145 family)